MKLPCEIAQDLILLYVDDTCSAESKKAVEEHLSQCPSCRRRLEAIQQPDITVQVKPEPEPAVQERVMKNGFRKLRRRWLGSVLSVFLLLPLILLTIMGINEYRGEGLAFTNLGDIFLSQRFMTLLESQKFEKAADLFDFASKYQEIQRALQMTTDDYMPHYEICMVDGEPWAVAREFIEEYHLPDFREMDQNGSLLFTYLILNRLGSFLVPEAVWTQIYPTIKDEIPTTGFQQREAYSLIDTVWGRFYVSYSLAEELEKEPEITADTLIPWCWFVPYEIYEEVQDDLEREALEIYQRTQARYAFIADITQEEYVQSMKEQFVQMLETCASNGITIQNPHYSRSYRIEDNGWTIEISATQQYPSGESFRTEYGFKIRNGKLRTVISDLSVSTDNDPIHDALWLHFSVP